MCTLGRSAAVLFLLLSAIRFVALPLARPLSLSLMSADTVQVEKAKALLLLRPSLGAAYDTLHTQALDDLRSRCPHNSATATAIRCCIHHFRNTHNRHVVVESTRDL